MATLNGPIIEVCDVTNIMFEEVRIVVKRTQTRYEVVRAEDDLIMIVISI